VIVGTLPVIVGTPSRTLPAIAENLPVIVGTLPVIVGTLSRTLPAIAENLPVFAGKVQGSLHKLMDLLAGTSYCSLYKTNTIIP